MPQSDTSNAPFHFDIQNAKPEAKPYKLADGGGLFLLVQPNQPLSWRPDSEVVERLARLHVVPLRLSQMRAVALLVDERQQRGERCADIADNAEIDGRATSDVLRPNIDLRNADARLLRDKTADTGSRSRA